MNDVPVPPGLKVFAVLALGFVWGVAAWAFSPGGGSPSSTKACATCSLQANGRLPVSDTLSPAEFLTPAPDQKLNAPRLASLSQRSKETTAACGTHPPVPAAGGGSAPRSCPGAKAPSKGSTRPPGASELIGQPAPLLALRKVGGGSTDLASGGNVTVLEFWRQSCPHCRRTLPQVAKLAEAYAGRSVRFVGVNEDTGLTDEKVLEFARSAGVEHEIAADDSKLASSAYRATGLPTIILVSAGGVIEAAHVGERSDLGQILARELDLLLTGATHASFPAPPKRSS